MRTSSLFFSGALLLLANPFTAWAHEVYVLDSSTIIRDIINPSPNPLQQIAEDPHQFILWALIGAIFVSTVFMISISRRLETLCNPFLLPLKQWAAPIARFTLGICLIASAYNNALFGPELALSHFGEWALFIRTALYLSGILIFFGLWTRPASLLALATFLIGIVYYKVYMLTYANYLGEIGFTLIVGSGRISLDNMRNASSRMFHSLGRSLEPYAFPILRILFGISIAFASYYAKFLHSQLALDVVNNYHLTNFFHFEPLFVVLGAFCVELLIGLFIMVGFEIRHTALFFLFWIFLSLLYFGEAVWPHLVLVGVLTSLFCHGYDKWSIEGYYFKHRKDEPFL